MPRTPVLQVVGLITDKADEEITGWETERAKSPSTAEKMVLKSQPGEPSSQASPAERTQRIIASPKARRIAKEKQIDLTLIAGTGAAGRIEERDILDFQKRQPKLTPLARKMAVEAGIEPGKVKSQGNAGRITRADLEKMLQSESKSSVPSSPTRESVITVRTIIAERMVHSHLTTAPVTLSTEADASSLVNLRTELNSAIRPDFDIPLSYNDFLVMITARALKEFPAMNTQWKDDRIIQLQEVNIGLAVETERGLLVPVIREANQKGLQSIARERHDLIERALQGCSLPDDLSGGTFTITNLGVYEIDIFTPIINLPQCCILGVGQILEKPVARSGNLEIQPRVWLSLTFDHRLVDGAPAASFLQRIKKLLEQPGLLIG